MQEISPTHTGCLLRKYRVVEIDTDFILEYIVPLHGNIIVAFKDAVSMPRQEGLRKFGALPVDLLLRIAKVMYGTDWCTENVKRSAVICHALPAK